MWRDCTYTNHTLSMERPGVGQEALFMLAEGILLFILTLLIQVIAYRRDTLLDARAGLPTNQGYIIVKISVFTAPTINDNHAVGTFYNFN